MVLFSLIFSVKYHTWVQRHCTRLLLCKYITAQQHANQNSKQSFLHISIIVFLYKRLPIAIIEPNDCLFVSRKAKGATKPPINLLSYTSQAGRNPQALSLSYSLRRQPDGSTSLACSHPRPFLQVSLKRPLHKRLSSLSQLPS